MRDPMLGGFPGFHPGIPGLIVWLFVAAAPARAGEPLRVVVDGTIEASPSAVREVLLDLDSFGRWFPWISEWRVLSRSPDTVEIYGRQDVSWPGRDRDYVARYRWWSEGGVFFLEAVGVADADPPAPRGVTRVHAFRSVWRIERGVSGKTRARYTAESPVGGRMRRWLARYEWRRHTRRVLDGLTHELERRRRTR